MILKKIEEDYKVFNAKVKLIIARHAPKYKLTAHRVPVWSNGLIRRISKKRRKWDK